MTDSMIIWEIPDLESYGNCEVRVYNRWGKLVFSSTEYHNEWDGTSNGVNLPSAAYYFIMKIRNSRNDYGNCKYRQIKKWNCQ